MVTASNISSPKHILYDSKKESSFRTDPSSPGAGCRSKTKKGIEWKAELRRSRSATLEKAYQAPRLITASTSH
jgi:hypothetical protein